MGLLVALALTGAGAIVYAIELQRIEEQAVTGADQELSEFGVLSAQGIDPLTGEPFANERRLLRVFLQRNVPGSDELLIGWWDGRPQIRLPRNQLTQDADFRAMVSQLVEDNGSARIQHPREGELIVTVQSVRFTRTDGSASEGALVVVTFLDDSRRGLINTMQTYAIVAVLSLLLVVAIAAWQSGRLLAPISALRATAREIEESDLSRRLPVRGNDDITDLTRTFNAMLDRLEEAFVGQRQFLDDAGHELRTPLTVLRGHLELLDPSDPEELAQTRDLLLAETDRMARLVGDLILLAKSDRPDFVQPGPVDLAGLTEDVLAKARGLGDRTWVHDGAPEIVLEADEQRITQALLAIADNAVKHTEDGAEIGIGATSDSAGVHLWVRDTGRGVRVEDRALIFERFGRSEVPEDDEGFGLGLSIVRAIVDAHGGKVRVLDSEPHGATFVLSFPPDRTDAPTVAG